MIRYDMPQRSEEWFRVRCGKLTASDAGDMLAKGKGGEAVTRRDLRARLVAERLTGAPQGGVYVNEAMQRGIEAEPRAIAAYEARRGVLVDAVGFLGHDAWPTGCSPDGLVGEDALVEIKCGKTATHIRYLRDPQVLVADYRAQLTHALWISGRDHIDIVSFDDRLPDRLALVMAELRRDEIDLAAHEAAVRTFLDEIDRDVASLLGWGVMEGV